MSGELANTGKILIYQNEKGDTKIDVYFEEDTIWMTQKAMCELYQVPSLPSVSISAIFLKMENWNPKQLFGNSEQFKLKEPGR